MLSDIQRGDLISKTFHRSEDEINAMFDSGMFNSIVKGAIIVTMQNLNYFKKGDIEDVIYELEHGTFEQYQAEDLRKAKLHE